MAKKIKLAKCPCCSTERHRTEVQTCIAILEKVERQTYKHYKEMELDQYTFQSLMNANIEWACDHCLKQKKAILSIPDAQETPWTPHLAYFDTPLRCSSCKNEFLFKKEEKKVWYESFKFPIKVQPDNCLDCRRKKRKHNAENKTLSDILKKSEMEITDDELAEIIRIYTSWDNPKKAKYYQSVLNKRHKKTPPSPPVHQDTML